MKELGGKNRNVSRTGPGLGMWGTFRSHIRAIVWVRGETFKAKSETADLWQPKWNENRQFLPQPYIPWTGTQVP